LASAGTRTPAFASSDFVLPSSWSINASSTCCGSMKP
jgi:hypothetical protein